MAKRGPKLGEELRWGDQQICYPCGAWRAESSNSNGSRCFLLPSLEIPYLFAHCFSEAAANLPCQGSGMSKVSRRTSAISLLQAVCCPGRPFTLPPSGAGLHLWKEITSPCTPYLCCIWATGANLINTEETSWEQLSARIDLKENEKIIISTLGSFEANSLGRWSCQRVAFEKSRLFYWCPMSWIYSEEEG